MNQQVIQAPFKGSLSQTSYPLGQASTADSKSSAFLDRFTSGLSINNNSGLDTSEGDNLYSWLNGAKDISEFQRRVESQLLKFGFIHYCHCQHSVLSDVLDLFGNFPKDVMNTYSKEEFYRDDMVSLAGLRSPEIVDEEVLLSALNQFPIASDTVKRNIAIQKLLRRSGLEHRITIPVHFPNYRALVTLSGKGGDPKSFHDHVARNAAALMAFAQAIDAVGSERFPSHFHRRGLNPLLPIGARALELFRLMMKDITQREAAKILGISESTAKEHVQAGKKATGATTLHGLLIAVERSGILDSGN